MIIKTVYRCDWPNCPATIEAPNYPAWAHDHYWEWRDGGEKIVCPTHRFKSSEELRYALYVINRPPAPLPWRKIQNAGTQGIEAADGSDVCDAIADPEADLVLKAVNNHEELLKACRAVEEWWLEEGVMLGMGGAPACIFMVREIVAKVDSPTPEMG